MQDERYRTVFAFPRMVEDLLRGFAAREWAGALDFSRCRRIVLRSVTSCLTRATSGSRICRIRTW